MMLNPQALWGSLRIPSDMEHAMRNPVDPNVLKRYLGVENLPPDRNTYDADYMMNLLHHMQLNKGPFGALGV